MRAAETMRTSAIGKSAIVAREAVVLRAYTDSVGVWTIGVGHTKGAGEPHPVRGMKITRQQALQIFEKDLVKFEDFVKKAIHGCMIEDHQFDALVSACFNLGPKWFISTPAGFIQAIKAGRYEDVPQLMMKFSHPSEVTMRRQGEANQFAVPYEKHFPKARASDRDLVKVDPYFLAEKNPTSDYVVPKPIAQPTVTLAPNTIKPTSINIAGKLAGVWAKLHNRQLPNVTVAHTYPPGFKGDPGIFQIQAGLRAKGYTEVGRLDGFVGLNTNQALGNLLNDNGIAQSSSKYSEYMMMSEDTLDFVNKAKQKVVSVARANATTLDVMENAPEVMKPITTLTRIGLGGLLTGSGLGGLSTLKETADSVKQTADTASSALVTLQPFLDTLGPVFGFVQRHPFLIMSIVGCVILLFVGGQTAHIVQMFRTRRIS